MAAYSLKSEMYKGFLIVFSKGYGEVWAGFPKNRLFLCGSDKKEAFSKMKRYIAELPSAVRNAYKKHGKTMRELEDL